MYVALQGLQGTSPGQIRTRPTSGAVVVFSSCLHSNGCKSASRPNVAHVLS